MAGVRRRLWSTKKRIAATVTIAILLLGGVAAAAWYSEMNGTGSNSTTTGSASAAAPTTVNVMAATNGLSPGGSVDLNWNATNSSGATEQLSAIAAAVTGDSNTTACPLNNFSITPGTAQDSSGPVTTFPADLPNGDEIGDLPNSPTDWTLNMSGAAPMGCQNVSVTYSITLS